jgi:methylated-DNA-[protein]-cysteine S-methyltransferase
MIVAVFNTIAVPWGLLHVAATERGVASIDFESDTASFAAGLARRLCGTVIVDGPGAPRAMRDLLRGSLRQLEEYLAGTRDDFDFPVDLAGLSDWERRVLEETRRIPRGHVVAYGRLAAAIGNPRAARAVGNALGRNPIAIAIPCHRVIAGDGTIGGYGGSGPLGRAEALAVKRRLLALEGVTLPQAG